MESTHGFLAKKLEEAIVLITLRTGFVKALIACFGFIFVLPDLPVQDWVGVHNFLPSFDKLG